MEKLIDILQFLANVESLREKLDESQLDNNIGVCAALEGRQRINQSVKAGTIHDISWGHQRLLTSMRCLAVPSA
jgi:hypothetical protein